MDVSLSDWHNRATGLIEIRPTVRVLLLDFDENTLLFCGRSEDGSRFWFTPGGEIEPGEDVYAAAHRELFEETGLTNVNLEAEVWRRAKCGMFQGRMREFRERWFLARVPRFEPNIAGFNQLERDTIVENRWWSLSELFVSRERLVPSDLAIRLEAVLRQGLPENPLDISPPAPKDECRAR